VKLNVNCYAMFYYEVECMLMWSVKPNANLCEVECKFMFDEAKCKFDVFKNLIWKFIYVLIYVYKFDEELFKLQNILGTNPRLCWVKFIATLTIWNFLNVWLLWVCLISYVCAWRVKECTLHPPTICMCPFVRAIFQSN
jgi:hypothetical protein